MKIGHVLLFVIFFLIGSNIIAQECKIILKVSGIKNIEGELSIGLYNNQKSFLKKGKTVEGVHLKVTDTTMTYVFRNLRRDNYAIAIYHDENANQKLDRNFLGLPSEDYVFSNYAKGFLGPPKFKDAMFTLIDSIKIKLNINE